MNKNPAQSWYIFYFQVPQITKVDGIASYFDIFGV